MARKHICWKTKCAAALLSRLEIPYADAKLMTEDQFLSLYHFDHNMLHCFTNDDVYWNLAPMLIKAHREKTKLDAKIIAKSKRIQRKNHILTISREIRELARTDPEKALVEAFVEGSLDGKQEANKLWTAEANRPGGALRWRKIPSRGFDKTRTRGVDGRVRKRRTRNVSRNYSPP
jgi:hypothetical protein